MSYKYSDFTKIKDMLEAKWDLNSVMISENLLSFRYQDQEVLDIFRLIYDKKEQRLIVTFSVDTDPGMAVTIFLFILDHFDEVIIIDSYYDPRDGSDPLFGGEAIQKREQDLYRFYSKECDGDALIGDDYEEQDSLELTPYATESRLKELVDRVLDVRSRDIIAQAIPPMESLSHEFVTDSKFLELESSVVLNRFKNTNRRITKLQ